MFALLQNPQNNLPTIVNMNSSTFAELNFMGYQTVATGYKKQMEEMEAEILVDFVNELELNDAN